MTPIFFAVGISSALMFTLFFVVPNLDNKPIRRANSSQPARGVKPETKATAA